MTVSKHLITPSELHQKLDSVMLGDQVVLKKRIKGARRIKNAKRRQAVFTEINTAIERSARIVAQRRNVAELLSYPKELPITARREEIVQLIKDNQVVVIAGETGSGKSTQLPKLCLEAGCGALGKIGHTQPRRIAARSVASRISDELGTTLGKQVGYSVRFDRRYSDETVIKVMTDGITLAELENDADLLEYDALIIDEAHERSLNIDFLLGYLHTLIERRKDLKVIITSATIDTERFSKHFNNAPVVEVSGRGFPVEIRYRPLERLDASVAEAAESLEDGHQPAPQGAKTTTRSTRTEPRNAKAKPRATKTKTARQHREQRQAEKRDIPTAVNDAVAELWENGPGDILVFTSGEREINDICESLRRHQKHAEVLPLFARLSVKDQQKIFAPSKKPRVIVSTNVAETSLTVPGIKYVIDVGLARISRYGIRSKVQRLPIEPVSQASANQRSGRCGRLGPGIAIRLYSEEDFNSRPAFTEPEIQRTNLSAVILTMATQRLGTPSAFPFVDPPDPKAIADGIAQLYELRAVTTPKFINSKDWITDHGRRLAKLPTDPRLAAIILAGAENGCLHEAVIVAAALGIQDPRERPSEKRSAADQAHKAFKDPNSDFLTLLNIWRVAREKRLALTHRQFRKWCQQNYLHRQRVNEWFDIVDSLRDSCEELGLKNSYSQDFDIATGEAISEHPLQAGRDIHQAVLAGLISNIGMKQDRSHEYLGARNTRFALAPTTALFEVKPPWLMAGSLLETSRLWARMVAPIDPMWLRDPASHLIKTALSDPVWDSTKAQAMVYETLRLYGLAIVADHRVPLAKHDRALARDYFIHHALIEGDWQFGTRVENSAQNTHSVWQTNAEVRQQARNLALRANQAELVDEQERLHAFFDTQLPDHVYSETTFTSWFNPLAAENPHTLELAVSDLIDLDAHQVDDREFPEQLIHGELTLDLEYESDAKSVTVEMPLQALAGFEPHSFDAIIPSFRQECLVALIRGLPKNLRKNLIPVPETVERLIKTCLKQLQSPTGRKSNTPGQTDQTQNTAVGDGNGALSLSSLETGEQLARFIRVFRYEVEKRTSQPLPTNALDPRCLPAHLRPHYRIIDEQTNQIAHGFDLAALQAELAQDIDTTVRDQTRDLTHQGAKHWDFGEVPEIITMQTPQGEAEAYCALCIRGELVGVDVFHNHSEALNAHHNATRLLLRLNVAAPLRAMNAHLDNSRVYNLVFTPYGDRKAWFEDLTLAALDSVVHSSSLPRCSDDFEALMKTARRDLPKLIAKYAPIAAEIIDLSAEIRLELVKLGEHLPSELIDDATEHFDRLCFPGHLSEVGLDRFSDIRRYLQGIAHRLDKMASRIGIDRDAMYETQSIERYYDMAAKHLPQTRQLTAIAWALEELRISQFAQHLGTREKVSAKRIRTRIDQLAQL